MVSLPSTLLALLGLAATSFAQDDLTLFHPVSGTTSYLVDTTGSVVQSWPGTVGPGLSIYFYPNGDLLRTQVLAAGGAGVGGGFERISYEGTTLWQYQNFSATFLPHHDVETLPNGNVLMIAWDFVGTAAALAAGRDPSILGAEFAPDMIVEVQQTGPSTGTIVWQWRAFEHLVQDFDAGAPDFGVVADNPQRIDLNYPPETPNGNGDWLHFNGIDYNPFLDQILVSVPNFDEIWVIDHSTTTAEAAGSSGGNSGKGGDLLYRWGNPEAYGRGTLGDKQLYFQHDATWIDPDHPGGGNILIFNNGAGRPGGDNSSTDEIAPPVDAGGNYSLTPGQAYGPAGLTWTYSDPGNFFSQFMGGAERLANGNTLITEATSNRIFEVTSAGSIVWDYASPFGGFAIFKARRYGDCSDGCPVGVLLCAGDGSGAACPCANFGGPGEGCMTTAGTGMRLVATGSRSIANDTLKLTAENVPVGNTGIFYAGQTLGAPSALFDGLQCVTGPSLRFTGQVAATSTVTDMDLVAQDPSGVYWNAGTTYGFHYFSRDLAAGPSPCGSFANLSNAWAVTMAP